MNTTKLCAAAAVAMTLTGAAQAATYSASAVIADQTTYGTCTGSPSACASNDRLNVSNVLGETDSRFYALGKNGQLTVGFDAPVFAPGATLIVEEVTFNGPQARDHFEAVDIYAVLGSVSTLIERITNASKVTAVQITQSFEYIRFVDVTAFEFPESSSFDGFDIDSVKVAAVPLPGAGMLMIAGLGGLAMIRRRRKAA